MKMRILILADASVPHTVRWCNMLADMGLEVLLFSLETPRDPVKCDVHLWGHPPFVPFKLRYVAGIKEFSRIMKSFSPHIINPHYIPNYGFIAALVADRTPIYLSVWGSDLLVTAYSNKVKFEVTRRILKRVDFIHVDAYYMADLLTKDFKVPLQKIEVFPFGVEPEFLEAEPVKIEELPGKWTVVSHRRLDADMDPMTVLRAAKLLKDKPFRFILLSDGALRSELERVASKEGIDVEFTGRLSKPDMLKKLKQGHIWVSASLTDSTPVSLLEAMALGLFPVVSNLPVLREWVLDGLNGLFFRPSEPQDLANALMKAISDREMIRFASGVNPVIIQKRANLKSNMEKLVKRWSALVKV